MSTICQVCGKVCTMQCEPFHAGDCLVCKICYDRYKDNLKLVKENPIKDPVPQIKRPEFSTAYKRLSVKYNLPVLMIIRIHLDLYDNCITNGESYEVIKALMEEIER